MNPSHRPPAWLMIATGMLVTVVVLVFARLAYGLILPPMRESLGLSYQQAGNLGTVTALGYLCLVMLAGAVAARWGARLAVVLGVVLATVGFIGLSLASNYALLLSLMALLGFGTAFGYTPLVSLLANWFPERRGAVIGLLNSGVGIGLVATGYLIPYLSYAFGENGWRLAWTVFAVGGVLVTGAVFAFLPNPPVQVGASGQPLGPVDKAAVYRSRHIITVGLLYGIIGITYIVQALFMFSFALDSGVTPLAAGRLAALMGFLSIFSGPCWGWLADRSGSATALILSMLLVLLGTAIPVVWPVLLGFAAHYVILGGSITGLFTTVLAASTERVEAHEAPLAVSYVTVFFAFGQFAGPAAAGLLIDWTEGFRPTFAASCLVMMFGLYLSWQIHTS